MNILIIGSGAREHAIARALLRSKNPPAIFCFGESKNSGIAALCKDYTVGNVTDTKRITATARRWKIDFALIGPEAPLQAGIVDKLLGAGIPAVGPARKLAQIETSKSFTRNLLTKWRIPGCPRYKSFRTLGGAQEFLEELSPNYVVKADGLMGGKGVKVAGDHLHTIAEALAYCKELVAQGSRFVIEEKLTGQEFSLMSFCDGVHLVHMPPVQDHKRAFAGDKGPNTGGMGSYSAANHLLPFLREAEVREAQKINQKTADALRVTFGSGYKGILYGGFMITAEGVKLIEYNARFGDPEAMNVLALLKTDFVEICKGIIGGDLQRVNVAFAHKATVCKYAVPKGYPDNPVKGQKIDASHVKNKEALYYGAVDAREDGLYETGSRTVAVLGIGKTIAEAEKQAEAEIRRIKGPLFHRKDIGTKKLITKRVEMMGNLKRKLLKLAILGSTRGTDMEAIVEAIKKDGLKASVELVISDKQDAYILERARKYHFKAVFLDPKGKAKDAYDAEIMKLLYKHKADLALLIGYMRILSRKFVQAWRGKIMNVHPSLLPTFAGKMDIDVHEAVLKSGAKETGCTVHYVTEKIDSGPIVVQKKCPVLPSDTPETLKAKVQKLEGKALIEAIKIFQKQ